MATTMVEDTSFEGDQLTSMTTEDVVRASRLLDNEIRILKEELQRTNLELESCKEKIRENQEKITLNKQLPYLVGNIVEILEMNPGDEAEEDGANIDLDSQRKGKCVVGVLLALVAHPGGILYRDLVPEYVKYARTIYEDDFGKVVVDVNYLNVGKKVPDHQIFIC